MNRMMKSMNLGLGLVTLGLALAFAPGCDKEDGTNTNEQQDSPVTLTRQGWTEFERWNWEQALTYFNQAIAIGTSSSDAYSGSGWAMYMMGDQAGAITKWNVGLTKVGELNDIRLGLALAAFDASDYESSVSSSLEIISNNPSYRFIHFAGVDILDVYWTLAQSNYLMGDYAEALQWVQVLNPVFETDVDTAQGQFDLAAEIERLELTIRG